MACFNGHPPAPCDLFKFLPLQSRSSENPKTTPYGRRCFCYAFSSSSISSWTVFGCRANMSEAPVKATTLRDICGGKVPEHILKRAEEVGYHRPTDVQQKCLPVLLSGQDCVLHAQTGSGKTLAYLLLIYSVINFQKSAVQGLIIVPTRELGMQVAKVARMLAAKSVGSGNMPRICTIMALLDGGMLKRHKNWLKAEPPEIVVATIGSLSQLLERHVFKLEAVRVIVVDEVDFLFNSSKQVSTLRKLLTFHSSIESRQTVFASTSIPQHNRFLYDCIQHKWTKVDFLFNSSKQVSTLRKLLTFHSSIESRQTVFASASIPQHNRFLYDCIQHKWTKSDVVHIHLNPVEPMPFHLHHAFMICNKKERLNAMLHLLQRDAPKSCIIFVSEQSEKSKKAGRPPSTTLLFDFLKNSYDGDLEVILFEEDMNFNARATSLSEIRQRGFLLVATDLASRGFDLPQTTHIFNFDLPRTAVGYLHRSGRTGRLPFSTERCCVTSLITPEERFVLQRFQNELMFQCKELVL